MISWLLRRLSTRHPLAARITQAVFLVGALAFVLTLALRDLRTGAGWLRPVLALVVLVLIAVRLAAGGLRRRV